jgi:hypothetical protein
VQSESLEPVGTSGARANGTDAPLILEHRGRSRARNARRKLIRESVNVLEGQQRIRRKTDRTHWYGVWMKLEVARARIRAPTNLTAHETPAIGFGIGTRHGGDGHPQSRGQLALRRQPLPRFEAAGLNFTRDGVGNLAVNRLTPVLPLGKGDCHTCNMSFDDNCSQT